MNIWGLFFNAIGQILLVCVIVGAGLPAIFALGVRWMAEGAGGAAEVGSDVKPKPGFKVLGVLAFAIVLVVILMALAIIVSGGFGYAVDFSHVIPTFHRKH